MTSVIIWSLAIFAFAVSIFTIGFLMGSDFIVPSQNTLYKDYNTITNSTNCIGMNLFYSSYCLRDELMKWYKYNISNIGEELTFEQLKTDGGVCTHFSEWYGKRLSELGFIDNQITFKSSNSTAHRITLASSEDGGGYCLLDQLHVHCIELAKKEVKNESKTAEE